DVDRRDQLLLEAHATRTHRGTYSARQPVSSADRGRMGMRGARRHNDAVQLWRRSAICGGDELHVGIVYCRPDGPPRRAETSQSLGIVRHAWKCLGME